MNIKKDLFREQINIGNNTIKKGPLRLFWRILIWLIIIALIICSIVIINFSISYSGGKLFVANIIDFFKPNIKSEYGTNAFVLSIEFLWNSIKLVFLSTFIGFIFALFTSYFSNLKMNSKYVAIPIKTAVIFLRIFPEVFFIYLFKVSFQKTIAIHLIYCWFTWLWLHEYLSQTIENANFSVFFQITKIKKSKWNAFFVEIWPQIKQKVINHFIYSFESNLRWSTILTSLSHLGIGLLLNPGGSPVNYSQLMIPLFVLVTFLIFLELVTEHLNKFLFQSRTIKSLNHKQYSLTKSIKRIIISLFILLGLIIAIYSIIDLSKISDQKFFKNGPRDFIRGMFIPNSSRIQWTFGQNGIFFLILQFLALVFLTTILTYVISYFQMLLIIRNLVGNYVAWYHKYLNILIRTIPITILFLLIANLFNHFEAAFVIAFAIHSSSSLCRTLYQSLNNIDEQKIKQLKKEQYSNFSIYRNFIRPSIKFDFITFITFEIEKITRNFITYGSLTSSSLGKNTVLNRGTEIDDVAIYLWIGFVIVAIFNLSSYVIRLRLNHKKWI
ncbi:Alkylphosphonate ABC transporter, permease protein (PhnB) [Metamycoplasma auris 15026]|uniref:Alkylphosphonate ABC transporter, permease protein (PhnB) n=1 Tax=Metamycoplasma auris 15026 TaxID=1188233 RepID=N9TSN3_9BACT|nr:ABC transporter permease subunit [Metamycoplasma auris]ENY69154.1 Alkylphosphonate ABC transporter, permease protein (PhnB) [Metamycoplasma auris 15026]